MRTLMALEHAHHPGAAGSAVRTAESPSGQRARRLTRSAATLPRLDGPVAMEDHQLSNAVLFELLDP